MKNFLDAVPEVVHSAICGKLFSENGLIIIFVKLGCMKIRHDKLIFSNRNVMFERFMTLQAGVLGSVFGSEIIPMVGITSKNICEVGFYEFFVPTRSGTNIEELRMRSRKSAPSRPIWS